MSTFTKWVAAATVGVAFMGSGLITPLYRIYQRAFHFSDVTLTFIYAAYVLGNLAALLFFGRLSDKIGRRPVAVASVALCALSVVAFLVAHSIVWLYFGRVLSGIAAGLASGAAAAWLSDLDDDKSRAAMVAAAANAFGFGLGPIVAGALAQYTGAPLAAPFYAYLPIVIIVALLVTRGCETVPDAQARIELGLLRPRVGVPAEIRERFVAPAIAVFGTFSIVGFYGALIPTILAQSLRQSHPIVGGAVVAELAVLAGIIAVLARGLPSRVAMLSALALFTPSVAALFLSQAMKSLPMLIVAAAIGAVCWALGIRGSLQVINEIAPRNQRAEVASAYYIIGFAGNSIPVIGIGVISALANPEVASLIFACTIAVFGLTALGYELVRAGRPGSERQTLLQG
jgi:MFS family permease